MFIPLIFIFDEQIQLKSFKYSTSIYFWFSMFISGVLGFSMSYVTGLQIQLTSALTHNVSSTAKAYAQTLIAVFYYNEIKTYLWWISNLLVLTGSAVYTHVRSMEMKEAHVKSSSAVATANCSITDDIHENLIVKVINTENNDLKLSSIRIDAPLK